MHSLRAAIPSTAFATFESVGEERESRVIVRSVETDCVTQSYEIDRSIHRSAREAVRSVPTLATSRTVVERPIVVGENENGCLTHQLQTLGRLDER